MTFAFRSDMEKRVRLKQHARSALAPHPLPFHRVHRPVVDLPVQRRIRISVDFPPPEGPITVTNSTPTNLETHISQRIALTPARVVSLAKPPHVQHDGRATALSALGHRRLLLPSNGQSTRPRRHSATLPVSISRHPAHAARGAIAGSRIPHHVQSPRIHPSVRAAWK